MTPPRTTVDYSAGRVCYPTRRDAALGLARDEAGRFATGTAPVRRPWFPGVTGAAAGMALARPRGGRR